MPSTIVPLRRNGKRVYAIVFHEDSLERIKNHDPAVVQGNWMSMASKELSGLVRDCDLMICYEEFDELRAKAEELRDKPELLVKWLSRHWEDRPGEATATPVKVGTLRN